MLDHARRVAAADIFFPVPEKAVGDFWKTIARCAEIYLQAYQPIDLPGAQSTFTKSGNAILEHRKYRQFHGLVYGKVHLIALVDFGHGSKGDDLEKCCAYPHFVTR